jgi:hypothetical protein
MKQNSIKPTAKFSRVSVKSHLELSTKLREILVGLLLGDLCAHIQKKRVNPILRFEQGFVHKDYLDHLYDLFEAYCLTAPKIYTRLPNKITGKIYSSVKFYTCALPCFIELYNICYPEGRKIVPANIGDLISPLGLAY